MFNSNVHNTVTPVTVYPEVINQDCEAALYQECLPHFDQRRARRQNFTLGDAGLVYQVTFRDKTIQRTTIEWSNLPVVQSLKVWLENLLGLRFRYCVVMFYPSGKSGIASHRDKESGDIIGLSIGCPRILRMTPGRSAGPSGPAGQPSIDYPLPSRSLYIIPQQINRYWLHSIPVDDSVSPRISLTFRQ
jgi:alkylated DNA repair dioxygenase AlkB